MPDTMTRPNGRPYRPRLGVRTRAWENPDDDTQGVVVLGTLDTDRAHPEAVGAGRYWYGDGTPTRPIPGWWRDAYVYRGERTWVADERRGTPGVMFTWESA